MQQIPRHPEVDQENPTRIEPNNQILASAIDGGDSLTFQLDGHTGGVERPGESRIEDLDTLESAPDEERRKARTNRLYLGELGHRASVARSSCDAARVV